MSREIAELAESARQGARPVAVAVTVDAPIRRQLGRDWVLAGTIYVEPDGMGGEEGRLREPEGAGLAARRGPNGAGSDVGRVSVDSAASARAAGRLKSLLERPIHEAVDPTARMMRRALTCPALALESRADSAAARLLESTCNSR
jgi:hypothetical protein